MLGDFSINPKECLKEAEVLAQAAASMTQYIAQIEGIKSRVLQLRGSGYDYVAKNLEQIIGQVKEERDGIYTLRNVLVESVRCYEDTERRINNTKAKKGEIKDIDNIVEDIAEDIGDIMSFWKKVLERFLEKILALDFDKNDTLELFVTNGIFGDGVMRDLRKLLSGTYVEFQWKSGSLYLKLKQNGKTNKQIAKWLEENLGGKWGEYAARNMKDYNFHIYDSVKNKFTRDMRYFENTSDAGLKKYLEDLGDLQKAGGVSFKKAFVENFDFWDDFNYSKYKDMTELGKAGKIMGTAGTVLDIHENAKENLYDSKTGAVDLSVENLAGFAWDSAVDIGAGTGASATGAAIGTMIGGPLGTVIGAGAGIALDYVANNVGVYDIDGDGEKDSIVENVKKGGKKFAKKIADIGEGMGDWLGEAFSFS